MRFAFKYLYYETVKKIIMDTKIDKKQEVYRDTNVKLNNPEALDHNAKHRIKSIELHENYTRIDFIFRAPNYYVNGGWIQIDRNCFIRESGTKQQFSLVHAHNITLAPNKVFFKHCGQRHEYSLFFPALPKHVKCIDIIEKEAPGTYFNFYDQEFSNWMTVEHPADIKMSNN